MTFEEKAYKAGKYIRKVVKKIKLPNAQKDSVVKSRAKDSVVKSRAILRKEPQATVVIDQPVYSKDRSRFFKDEYEKEKRRFLFK